MPESAPSRRQRYAEYFDIVAAIVRKDLAAEARRSEVLAPWATYGVMIIVVLWATVDISTLAMEQVGSGLIWVSFILVGAMGLSRSFAYERSHGAWEALLMAPVDHSAIYFGKLISNLLFTLVAEIAVLVAFAFLFGPPANALYLLFATIMGTLGFVSVGTLLAAFTSAMHNKELLLPIMLLPMVIPVIAIASGLTSGAFAGAIDSDWLIIVVFLTGYDLLLVAGGATAFSFMAELY